jgi:aspartyl-tRNA(Asn)/glutamyl-tRNA(Gln) amidotransferase subunit C
MITKEDIKNLADLARIDIPESEAESLTRDIDSILGYVSQIKNATGNSEKTLPKLRNVLREDVATHAPNEYTDKLLKNAPSKEKNFLRVKKIL